MYNTLETLFDNKFEASYWKSWLPCFFFGKKLEINGFHSLKFKHKIIDQTGGFVGYFIAFVPGAVSPRPSRSPDIGDIQNERGVTTLSRF